MKYFSFRFLTGFTCVLMLAGAFFPQQVTLAQNTNTNEECDTVFCGPGLSGGVDDVKQELEGTGIPTEGTITQAILFWVRILLILAGIIAFVAFVWAGFLYITTFVSEENNEKAKKIMISAAIGIIVILFSYILTSFLITATV